MNAFLYYPLYLLLFWYKSVIGGLFVFFIEFNRYVASLLSIPLLIKTFFKPLKNEYRDGLVLFSILFGIFVKTMLIFVTGGILLIILFTELLIGALLAFVPVAFFIMLVMGNTFLR